MRTMNKKAQGSNQFDFIMSLAVLLIIIVVLLIFYADIGKKTQSHSEVEICRESIELSALTKVGGIQTYDHLQCPTNYLLISGGDEEKIKKELGNEMVRCFYKLGKGELELFELKPGKEVNYCVVCSVIDFEDKAKDVVLTDFTQFLLETKVPLKYGSSSMYAYLYGQTPEVNIKQTTKELEDDLTTSVPYSVLFFYAKKSHINKALGTGLGIAGGFVVGSIGGLMVASGVAAPVGIAVISAVAGGGIGYATSSDDSASWKYSTVLYPYTKESLTSLGCEELAVAQGNK